MTLKFLGSAHCGREAPFVLQKRMIEEVVAQMIPLKKGGDLVEINSCVPADADFLGLEPDYLKEFVLVTEFRLKDQAEISTSCRFLSPGSSVGIPNFTCGLRLG